MCQSHDLRIVLQSSGVLLFCNLQLSLLERPYVGNPNALAELCEDTAFCLVNLVTECVDPLLEVIVNLLSLKKTSESKAYIERRRQTMAYPA